MKTIKQAMHENGSKIIKSTVSYIFLQVIQLKKHT